MQGLGGVVGDRIVRQRRMAVGPDLEEQAVDDAARRPSGDDGREFGLQAAPLRDQRAVVRRGRGLGTGDEGAAHLDRAGAVMEGGADLFAVHDAAGRDQRQRELVAQLFQQLEGGQGRVGCGRIEDAAVSAGFDALGDDHVDAGCFNPQRLVQRSRSGEQDDAGGLQRVDPVLRRQAEMEADHGRTRFQQQLEHRLVRQEAAVDFRQRGGRLGAELSEVRTQPGQPGGFARRIGLGRRMGEHVGVEGTVGLLAHRRDGGARRLHGRGAQGDRAEPARFRDGGGQRRGGNARHRGLDDGVADVQLRQQVVAHGCGSVKVTS